MAGWLQCRRRDAATRSLARAFSDGLKVLPGWQDPPRTKPHATWYQAARCPQRIPVVGKAVFPVLITAAAKKSLNWASGFTNGAASCTLVNSMLPKAKHLIKLYPDGRSREATDRESVRSCAGPRAAGCTRTPD